MAMFLLHIAFLLALALFGAGLVLWHRGAQPTAGVLRIGGGRMARPPGVSESEHESHHPEGTAPR